MNKTPVLAQPRGTMLETVRCYYCGSDSCTPFLTARDDLTGKPGSFHFVTCNACGFAYQNPRITLEGIKEFYDDDYIAYRKKNDWGFLTWCYRRAMEKIDRRKNEIVGRYVKLSAASHVLDVGCGAGTFLASVHALHGSKVVGLDFTDLSQLPSLRNVEFHCGLFYEQDVGSNRFDLVTMWHFLEHDYDPQRSLTQARAVLKKGGCLIIEVPRLDSLTFRLYRDRWPGLQAPQHTALYAKETLLRAVEKTGLEVIDYLPYGAFPAYFYLFLGLAFKLRRGKGVNLSKAIYPYFLGQLLLSPILLFERHLNLAMQTVVCRRPV